MRFRVFLGAPSLSDLDASPDEFCWWTFRSDVYPQATLDAASHRISLLYRNVIFDDDSESEQVEDPQQTILTWPPTAVDTTGPSFLRPSGSARYDTQETGSSLEHSDASSIARFPSFQFSLHELMPLSVLYAQSSKGSRKINVLLAALEVQGPDTVRAKKGRDAGHDVSILKLILGDDQGSVCKLTAWRETADAWGGLGPTPGITRGDILYFENLVATWEPGSTVTLTASPYNKPTIEICYRTMPYTRQDSVFRPDLRLGQSDAAVNRVAALARWFQDMAGLPGVS